MTLTQHEKTHSITKGTATCHLETTEHNLLLYVPQNKQSQEVCFCRQLPRRLLRYLEISDPGAEAVFSQILGSNSLESVDAILKDAGIIEIEGITRPAVIEEDHWENEVIDTPMHDAGNGENRSIDRGRGRGPFSFGNTEHPEDQTVTTPNGFVPQGSNAMTSAGTASDSLYTALLDHVIQCAKRAKIPGCGKEISSQSTKYVDEAAFEGAFRKRQFTKPMIGAAGELFVSSLQHLTTIKI